MSLEPGVKTTCPYCGVGCGVRALAAADGSVSISGDTEHPANRGRLCVKGSALGETLGLEGRLLHPEIAGQRVSWDAALDHIANGFKKVIAQHGPDAVAFYVSGQLLTEDYYVANKLMKGFIGSANIDTNSRLCMSSAVAGHVRAFGEDLVPCNYEDLELADLVVLVGSNTAWCHPILFQRLSRAREARPAMKLVVIDPRRTATCEGADLHLAVKPGSDVWLFNGLLQYLAARGHRDETFIAAHTEGLDAALAASQSEAELGAVAERCGVSTKDLLAFYALFAATPKVVTAFSMGVNQSSAGTDKVNSIINVHLLTGRIGAAGMGPFSITGQPNAMGGREVGGLANQLAAHLNLDDLAHRDLLQGFWASPRMASTAGLKAVDLFEAIHTGRVKAVWIMATNPVVSLPDADRVREALQGCALVVSSDIVRNTETNACASVLLPALGWGEKDGTVTNTERCISRQRAFLPAPGEARADWLALCQVAQRMGFTEGFHFADAASVFDEHARLSAAARVADPARLFDLGALAGLGSAAYEAMAPLCWPLPAGQPGGTPRLFADRQFAHPDRRARFVPTPARGPQHATSPDYPLALNTGRLRDHWHTMTRTGRSPRLSAHIAEPFVDLHADDAARLGIEPGHLAEVSSAWGSVVLRAETSGAMSRGELFVPIHWSAPFASDARIGKLVNPAVDPFSGEPEFKHTPARITKFATQWFGFALLRAAPAAAPQADWWTRISGYSHTRLELAGAKLLDDPQCWVQALVATEAGDEWIDAADASAGWHRFACIRADRLEAVVFLAAAPDLPSRRWLAELFQQLTLSDADRRALMAGAKSEARTDQGPVVCACFGVGRNTLVDAIRLHELKTPAAIGACLKAGTNCGSCVPELRQLLASCAAVVTH